MYDTVNMWIGCESMGGVNPLQLVCNLTNILYCSNDNGVAYCRGNLRNYIVCISPRGISLKGSLAKFYLGDNIGTLTRRDTQKALDALGDMLGVSVMGATVTRVDVAGNKVTQRPPADYFSGLGNKSRYKRIKSVKTESLYYKQNNMQLAIYDKIRELKQRGASIPKAFAGCNVLRYELRFLKQRTLKEQLEKNRRCVGKLADGNATASSPPPPMCVVGGSPAVITASMLVDEDNYYCLCQLWKDEFLKIQKINTLPIMTKQSITPAEGVEYLLSMLLRKEDGAKTIDEYISALKAQGKMQRPKDYSMLKSRLNTILQQPNEQPSDMNNELEMFVRGKALKAR